MIDFVKPDKSVINRVIYYSILIRDIRVTLLQLRKAMIMIRGLRITVPSFSDLREVETELIRRQNEVMQSCMLLLSPLLEGIDFGHKYLNHWVVSMHDIKQGYCELEEIIAYKNDRPNIFGRKYILLFDDYEDSTLGKFYSGELVPLEKAIHFIDNILPKKDKSKGLYEAVAESINLASRFRTSKLLSNE